MYELVLLTNIFGQLFQTLFGSFFLVFLGRLPYACDIQIDLKMKYL